MNNLERKYHSLEIFKNRLLQSELKDQIVKLILHGSVRDGTSHRESDIDVLVVAFDSTRKLGELCSDLAFDIMLDTNERVEPMVFPYTDYLNPSNYFMYLAKTRGKEIYSMAKNKIKIQEANDLLKLSRLYLKGAKENLQNKNNRITADAGYNSCELCVKALLLLKIDTFPKTHGGVVGKFGEIYVKSGDVPKELGRALNKGLDLRNKARYVVKARLTKRDAESMIKLAEKLIEIGSKKIKHKKS